MKYFYTGNKRRYLKILDNPPKKPYRKFYTGVKLPYIKEYVLKNKYTNEEIADYILEQHDNGQLEALFCPDVQDVVIHPKNGQSNYIINDSYGYTDRHHYDYFINHLNTFKNEQ